MNTETLRSSLHTLIEQVHDAQILAAVYTILDRQRQEETDFWTQLTPAQQADIRAGLADLDAGRKVPAAEVFARYQ